MNDTKYYVGSCQHDIPEDWFNSDASTYIVVDEATGICTTITTCKECKDAHEAENRILDESELPEDDFSNPFSNDTGTRTMKAIMPDGSVEIVEVDETNILSNDELNKLLDT